MKTLSGLLLSILGTVGFTGTNVAMPHSNSKPQEPPSITSVVHNLAHLSVTTQTQTDSIPAPATVLTVVPRQSVFTVAYRFNEKSKRVTILQKALKTVRVDGIYGPVTRREHIEALQAIGLPTDVVPAIPVPEPQYNISNDPEHRCPAFEEAISAAGLAPVDVFSYIAYRESRCRVGAINAIWKNGKIVWTLNKDGSYDSGLLQINSSWKTVVANVCKAERGNLKVLLVLDCNLKVAKYIMDNSQGKLANWRVYRTN
jgi:hypothetical protein